MSKRINIILPEETVAVLDKAAPKGRRSNLISKAVMYYVQNRGHLVLREQLKVGYQANAGRDLNIAQEWFPLEEEAWKQSQKKKTPKK